MDIGDNIIFMHQGKKNGKATTKRSSSIKMSYSTNSSLLPSS
jgi:hypothetical protein